MTTEKEFEKWFLGYYGFPYNGKAVYKDVRHAYLSTTKATAARCVSLSEPVKECDCGRCNSLRDLRAVIKLEFGLE